jgi:hypothetical protein
MAPFRKLARLLYLLQVEWPRRAGFWLGMRVGPYVAAPIVWVLWQVRPLRPRLARWAVSDLTAAQIAVTLAGVLSRADLDAAREAARREDATGINAALGIEPEALDALLGRMHELACGPKGD